MIAHQEKLLNQRKTPGSHQLKEIKTGLATPVSPAVPGEENAAYWKRKYEQLAAYNEEVRTRFRESRTIWKDWAEKAKEHESRRKEWADRLKLQDGQRKALKLENAALRAEVEDLKQQHVGTATPTQKRQKSLKERPVGPPEEAASSRDPLALLPVNAIEDSQDSAAKQPTQMVHASSEHPEQNLTQRPTKPGSDDETQDNGKPTPGRKDRFISIPAKVEQVSPVLCLIKSEESTSTNSSALLAPSTPTKEKRPHAIDNDNAVKRLCVEADASSKSALRKASARHSSAHIDATPASPQKQIGCGDVRRTQSFSLFEGSQPEKHVPLWKTLPPKRSPLRLPQQPKNIGRYASMNKPVGQIDFRDFAIDPSKNEGVDYAFQEPVRGQEARNKLHAKDCRCCSDYYRLAGPFPDQIGPKWRDRDPDEPEEPKLSDADRLKQQISRHRERWHRSPTPEIHWRADFPSTQEYAEEARLAEERKVRKLKEMEQEAHRGNGRIIFRENKKPSSARKRQ
jgi:hypothetical protein